MASRGTPHWTEDEQVAVKHYEEGWRDIQKNNPGREVVRLYEVLMERDLRVAELRNLERELNQLADTPSGKVFLLKYAPLERLRTKFEREESLDPERTEVLRKFYAIDLDNYQALLNRLKAAHPALETGRHVQRVQEIQHMLEMCEMTMRTISEESLGRARAIGRHGREQLSHRQGWLYYGVGY
ncbi:hypothetical protein JCM1840_000766 [Sporobolomyces johnsonii]